jgi:serine/threonine protein kinase
MRPGSIQLTQEGMVFGTPEFMSPEQAQGKTLDARSDIYSLAVILYEALSGKLPFEARTPMEYIQKHVLEAPIPLHVRAPERTSPPGLWEAIARALAKAPEQRYQTAIEFAGALRPFAGSNLAAVDSIFQMYPEPPAFRPPAEAPPPSSRQAGLGPEDGAPLSRKALLVLVGGAIVCLLLGAGLAAFILLFLNR